MSTDPKPRMTVERVHAMGQPTNEFAVMLDRGGWHEQFARAKNYVAAAVILRALERMTAEEFWDAYYGARSDLIEGIAA